MFFVFSAIAAIVAVAEHINRHEKEIPRQYERQTQDE